MMPMDTSTERFVGGPVASAADARKMAANDGEDSVNLLDLAIMLASRKRFIFGVSLLFGIVAAVVTLLLPKTFTARTTMMPPQKESSASAMLGQLGGLASLAGGGGGAASVLGLKNPADLYIGLLESRTIADALIQQFDLMKVYKAKRWSGARKELAAHTKILADKSSLIRISVQDHSARRAAAIANAYIEQLHDLMSHLAVTEAAQRRLFFDQQLQIEKEKLAEAEAALAATERRTGIIQPQGQAQAVIATIMQLQAQISAAEVELGALRTSATDQNPDVVTLQSQIVGLRAQLADFEKGHPQSAAIAGNVLTPTSQVPAASLEYIRRARDVRFHETLFELLAQQYEMAKVDEAKQAQMIQVVDPALVPDMRSWPPRTLLVLLAIFLGLLLSSFWVILQSAYRMRMEDPLLAAKVNELRKISRLREPPRA